MIVTPHLESHGQPLPGDTRIYPRHRGFALVATISVMVLLVMIALAMLSMATLEQRAVRSDEKMAEARANARMALMLALGELQKHTGPDQRVTAEADILDTEGFAGWSAASEKKHYVGVYATDEWHERDSDNIRKSLKRYHPDRNVTAFRRWLVSGDSSKVNALDYVRSALDPTGKVIVLGSGTVGGDSSNHVYVSKEIVADSSGAHSGGIAWWVADQGVKAKVNLTKKQAAAASPWEERFQIATPGSHGVELITGMENLDELQADDIDRLLSQGQIAVLGGRPVSQEHLASRYHDITTVSHGVLADVALGGLKRDLSLPFELPRHSPPQGGDWTYALNRPDDIEARDDNFTSIWEFSNSGDQNAEWESIYWPSGHRPDWWANKMGYCFMLPDSADGDDAMGFKRYLRGPTWQSLRNHYRSYKRDYEQLSASSVSRRGWITPADDRTWLAQPYQPYSHWHNAVGEHLLSTTYVGAAGGLDTLLSPDLFDPFYRFGNHRGRAWNNLGHDTLGRAPVFTKIALVLSHQSQPHGTGRRLEIVMNAVGTIWNPYNVPIEFESVFANLDLKGLRWNFTRKRPGGQDIELAIDPEQRTFGREKYFPYQHFRFGVTAEKDPDYPFSSRRPSKMIRLNPGECRTFALNLGSPRPYSWANMTSVPGSFSNNWQGGMSLAFTNKWHVEPGDKFKFELLPQADEKLSLETYLGYFQETAGAFTNPFDSDQRGVGFKDLPELASLHIASAADVLPLGGKVEKLLSHFTDQQEAICYIEFRRRASDDSSQGVLAQFDPRSIVNHSHAMGPGEKGSLPDNWDVRMETVSDFDLMQAGIGDRNNGFWGNSHEGDGQTHVVAFDVPDAPIANIAALQHCQTGPNGWDVSYAIGNSLPHPRVPLDELYQQVSSGTAYRTTFYDMSYLANQGLWDSYYFSGVHLSGNGSGPLQEAETIMRDFLDPTQSSPLANKRLVAASRPANTPEKRRIKELTHYRWMARHLMVDGPANINSTRVEAWKAWLASMKGEVVDQVQPRGNLTTSPGDGTPFVRAQVSGGDDGESWKGYTRLSDSEIETLAENIVVEVRKRGPFLSVADFINRRLADDDTGRMGALQAALESSGLDTGSDSEAGIPGTLKQGDLLNSLGATISARSDTFVIRAYGEAVAAKDASQVLARAWCEAVVQRMPTLVNDNGALLKTSNPEYPGNDPSGLDAYIENSAVAEPKFGRAYRIIAFRWLNEDEV